MPSETRLLSTVIARPWKDVYAYASDPRHLVDWAAGLASAQVEPAPDRPGVWIVDAPFGRSEVTFAPDNEFGVLDHVVLMPDGTEVPNPLRVVPLGDGAEVVFHVRRRAGMSDDDFAGDAAAVAKDLETLRRILENA
ncbi:polyketide cyclase/dehydrase/lipid transport protein [Actinomycetospora succinea]|uniref:Polyketide cyclase/dehydrase/lipid transport protein n=1 Tax=Actinomycetospora succinea TaxID=663603 RepID=A0A4R6VAE0_9PSEU|nr:SRPBCC family protein [Actinomycetospora succinea]TDQ58633.1 polyketide cyclase/dehydrase/lipid transport protein [Actinomycetospora succinea]